MEDKRTRCGALGRFALDVLYGVAIGVAFIIPGFSGGSIAAILGIYERLIGAIADFFKSFKKSVLTLLPVAIGMVIGVVSLLFPLSWALDKFPIPTVCIFVGLAIGGLPSVTDNCKGKFKPILTLSFTIPLLLAFGLSFIPKLGDVNLFELDPFGYVLLFIVGAIGSAALVIPGISGSMLLLILGYYNPIVSMATEHLLRGRDVGISLLVLCCVGVGIVVGFFIISIIMKSLLAKHKRGTYIAILGFILGSIPSVFSSVVKDSGLSLGELMPNAFYWIISALLLAVGFALSFTLVIVSKKKDAHAAEEASE